MMMKMTATTPRTAMIASMMFMIVFSSFGALVPLQPLAAFISSEILLLSQIGSLAANDEGATSRFNPKIQVTIISRYLDSFVFIDLL